jgi:hypothetical protein
VVAVVVKDITEVVAVLVDIRKVGAIVVEDITEVLAVVE